MERWIGKIAVVTGASSGIGEAIAKVFVGAGINVVGVARREDRLQALSKSLQGSKGSLHAIRADVRNEADILKAFKYADDKFGGVDILVNNAGICHHKAITEDSTEHLRAILEVNVLAPAVCARETVKSIRRRGVEGHIFNINRFHGFHGGRRPSGPSRPEYFEFPLQAKTKYPSTETYIVPFGGWDILGLNATLSPVPISLYPASKFALHALTENLRQETRLNNDNIRVTGIYPGLVKTEILEMSGGDPRAYNKLPHIQGEDIPDAIMYALSTPLNVQVEEIKINALHLKL